MKPDQPAAAREVLERNRELARRLGYTPESQRPEAMIASNTPQARIDELIAAGYRPVIDPQLDRMLGLTADPPRFETDPDTGRREYKGSFASITAAAPGGVTVSAGYSSSRPQAIMERPSVQYLRTQGSVQAELDRFAGNPGEAWFRSIMPGASFAGPAPTMFATGELPPITASGLDPSVLRWVAWPLRHSAAFTPS